ncbi:hypothetical protein M9H77_24544 [Catharanthus roseus]|uniref:Uncharacterized protein n=1 Tax=Catharanthus roseus TaxID=4058 RepID=A0ACC0B0A1_CATRO|nr:hypothetical protein M9H77_24544 [Catharanthus roseus]
MEDRKANIIAVSLVAIIVISIIVARLSLRLSNTFFLILGADVAAIVAIAAVMIIRRRFNSRRKRLETQMVSEGRELRIEYSFLRKVAGVPIKFRYKELEDATDGFRSLLGRGASGAVFKGILSDGTEVAVKRIEGDQERGEKEFRSEVSAIASVQHVNLVRLLGYCIVPSGPRFLVYEFVYHGSLDKWIFPKIGGQAGRHYHGGCLTWDLRCRVALDVAKALSYLHHDCRSCILHLDVKPENILLDAAFHALVSDFGLSKLMGKEESRVVTNIRGTKGYLAPEWILENGISEKSDVYSYGMVLLEIIGGRRNIRVIDHGIHKSERKFQCFSKIVSEKLREGKVMEIVDERLVNAEEIAEIEVKKLVYIALWCIQEKPKLRPSMALVVEMLEGRVPVDEPPETEMLVVDFLSPTGGNGGDRRHRQAAVVKPYKEDNSTTSANYSFVISELSGR